MSFKKSVRFVVEPTRASVNVGSEADFPSLAPARVDPKMILAPLDRRASIAANLEAFYAAVRARKASAATTTTTRPASTTTTTNTPGSQQAPLAPAVPQCQSAFCPVINGHAAKAFKAGDEDLPYIIKAREARERELKARGGQLAKYDSGFLNEFYTIHGTVGDCNVPTKAAMDKKKVDALTT